MLSTKQIVYRSSLKRPLRFEIPTSCRTILTTSSMDISLIIVIGPSGSGKSTFINLLSGSSMKVATGELQESCTATVEPTKPFVVDGKRIVLLDTPGFDNTLNISNRKIPQAVEEYVKFHRKDMRLKGVIYIHAIDERRVNEVDINLMPFERLCGDILPSPVVFVTTRWDSVDANIGAKREYELKKDKELWASALERGARIQRHDGTSESAEKAVLSLLKADPYLIAVVGPIGSGKTTFTNLASGSKLEVGDDIRGCTMEVTSTAPFSINEHEVVLLDTPGFSGTSAGDEDILEKIAQYMIKKYKKPKSLDGVLYFRGNANKSVREITPRNWRLLESLCRYEPLKSVVIVTNMWGLLPATAVGDAPEKQLVASPGHFGRINTGKSTHMRHCDTKESSHKIISCLIDQLDRGSGPAIHMGYEKLPGPATTRLFEESDLLMLHLRQRARREGKDGETSGKHKEGGGQEFEESNLKIGKSSSPHLMKILRWMFS